MLIMIARAKHGVYRAYAFIVEHVGMVWMRDRWRFFRGWCEAGEGVLVLILIRRGIGREHAKAPAARGAAGAFGHVRRQGLEPRTR
ncbi:hypothetical protein ABT404_29660 [Streptomyces hyaluromycini]|uniref:Transposase n=1 Tax=Streptomyces hyaluromycini TaxID=1377993 RepID=A0ABV1X3K6_9ACTN